jgi:maleylpyruvate isomerase
MNEASHSLDRLAAATGRLLASATALTDAHLREPSLLPGWTRGHVLTHIARNADGMVNLLHWARTGTETPMYASAQSRSADIEAGAGRPAADLAADVRDSAAAFAGQAAAMPDDAWTVAVRALNGPPFPALGVLDRRLSEVEIHHVDLAAGYSPGDWPADFVAGALPRVAGSFAGRDDTPVCLVWAEGAPHGYRIGPASTGSTASTADTGSGPVVVHGPPAELLAWLLGRDSGAGLRVSGEPAATPVLPAWR